jgi:hypothetical protein
MLLLLESLNQPFREDVISQNTVGYEIHFLTEKKILSLSKYKLIQTLFKNCVVKLEIRAKQHLLGSEGVGREMEWGKRERAGGRKSKDPIIV